ncbi:MAG: hypothetical protein ACAI44_31530 [Candidatus Sericytochromatia bacterium]
MRHLLLSLFLLLSGCAAARQGFEPDQHPFRDVNQVVQDVYRVFPEIPASHVFVTYDHMVLDGKRQLYVQQLRFFVPSRQLEQADFQQRFSHRARDLFEHLGSLNPECASVSTGQHDIFFTGIDVPLREVLLELACG